MKKLAYALIFIFAFGVSFLMLPYFRSIGGPSTRFVYANVTDNFISVDLTGKGVYTDEDISYKVLNQSMIPSVAGAPNSTYIKATVADGKITGYQILLSPSENYIFAENLDFYGKTLTVSGFGAGKIIDGNGYGIERASFSRAFVENNRGTIKYLTIFNTCSVSGASVTITNSGTLLGVENYAYVNPFNVYDKDGKLSDTQAGGLAAINDADGVISNSTNYAEVKGHGGIAMINRGKIEKSTNSGRVSSAFGTVGGIVGENDGGLVDGCVNYADVDGKAPTAGGIAGTSDGKLTDVENRGIAAASGIAGGIAGTFKGEISKAVNFGLVKALSGSGIAGGIAGTPIKGTAASDAKISDSQNFAVVIGAGSAKGILGSGSATISGSTKNYGRLNGKTEFTVQIDEALDQYKMIIVGIAAAAVAAGIVSIIIDRYKSIRNRRQEIDTILAYTV
jgi:hypothetical protein